MTRDPFTVRYRRLERPSYGLMTFSPDGTRRAWVRKGGYGYSRLFFQSEAEASEWRRTRMSADEAARTKIVRESWEVEL